jgi:hypothetical protein
MRGAGRVARMGRAEKCILTGEIWSKETAEKPWNRFDDYMNVDLKVLGWGGDWFYVAQDRAVWLAVVNTVMNFWVL